MGEHQATDYLTVLAEKRTRSYCIVRRHVYRVKAERHNSFGKRKTKTKQKACGYDHGKRAMSTWSRRTTQGREQINKQKDMSMRHGKRVMWTWSDRRHSSFGKTTNKQTKIHVDASWKTSHVDMVRQTSQQFWEKNK